MRSLKYFALLAILGFGFSVTSTPAAQAQVGIGIGIGGGYPDGGYAYGPPACQWGYYGYAPYKK